MKYSLRVSVLHMVYGVHHVACVARAMQEQNPAIFLIQLLGTVE